MINIINDSDQIFLHSTESYLKSIGTPMPSTPQEKLYIMQNARDVLYSDNVARAPRIAAYIMQSNIDEDDKAKALFKAFCEKAKDPVFVQLLMQYLAPRNNQDENGIIGAMLSKIMAKLLDDDKVVSTTKVIEKKSDKDKTAKIVETTTEINVDKYKHIYDAVQCLLGNLASIIATKCGNITVPEAMSIAACIVMNNDDTVKEVIDSDLPISAQVFDILNNPTNVIKSALNLNKADYTKLTTNQSNFIETLKKWVYEKLNVLPTYTAEQLITAAYGSLKPDTSMKLIQLKDCGTQYSNLLMVAKQIINN
jgi:hypothetical protein